MDVLSRTLPNYGLATEGLDPMYTSPISYLDSIMNGKQAES